ncbi:MAG: septal ring lytic transglycosylase RlpA family protein, partial [Nitrospinaceae bacterium]
GNETLNQKDGHMTANGEAFNPNALSAAHKHLPLPTNVKVTNLQNGRSVIVRVNDRGPFPSDHNPASGRRIIDVSYAAAKQLGFQAQGTARVRVETIQAG